MIAAAAHGSQARLPDRRSVATVGASMSPRGATKEQTETETKTRPAMARPWNVIVHDDPVTLMTYVSKVFMQVFGYPTEKAQKLMMEVHKTGRSIVWTGAREQAEVYAQKLQAHHLLTTLEQVDG